MKQPDTPDGNDWDWDEVVTLTPGQVEEFIPGCAEVTKAGLKVIAEKGPTIRASLLEEAGVTNYGSFQGALTKRARTVTGDEHACLLAYDDWSSQVGGMGHYAVTEGTFRSSRIFFNLE